MHFQRAEASDGSIIRQIPAVSDKIRTVDSIDLLHNNVAMRLVLRVRQAVLQGTAALAKSSSLSDLTHHCWRVRIIVLILTRDDGRFDGQFSYD